MFQKRANCFRPGLLPLRPASYLTRETIMNYSQYTDRPTGVTHGKSRSSQSRKIGAPGGSMLLPSSYDPLKEDRARSQIHLYGAKHTNAMILYFIIL